MIVAQRLRKGACGRPRGAKRLVADAVDQARRLLGRAAESWCGWTRRSTAAARSTPRSPVARRCRSPSARRPVKAAIASIAEDAWTTIEYTDAVFDETPGRWISRAEVAEIDVHRVRRAEAGRPGARPADRAPDPRLPRRPDKAAGQDTCSTCGGSTRSSPPAARDRDTVTADKTHRGHAIIEQVHADLKNSALAHLPSGVFTANAAWLVLAVIAFNLTRAAATLTRRRNWPGRPPRPSVAS